jgi:hypothetical protein
MNSPPLYEVAMMCAAPFSHFGCEGMAGGYIEVLGESDMKKGRRR